jgi:hypothetical protein
MEPAAIAVGLAGLLVGVLVGRRSARGPRRRVIRTVDPGRWPANEEIESLVRAGRHIDAIRRHREIHGSDLREAKDAIDAIAARLPSGA